MAIENKLVTCNFYPYQKTGLFPFDWKNEEDGKPSFSTHPSPKMKEFLKTEDFSVDVFAPTYVRIAVTKVLKQSHLAIRASVFQRSISSKTELNFKLGFLTTGSKAFSRIIFNFKSTFNAFYSSTITISTPVLKSSLVEIAAIRASIHQIEDKNNNWICFKAFISKCKFRNRPTLGYLNPALKNPVLVTWRCK